MSSSLSIRKLFKFIESCGFYSQNFFTVDGLCTFVKIVSKLNYNSYMLYIPSKYNIDIQTFKSHSLKQINNPNNPNDITLEYGYDKDNKTRENLYQDHGSHKAISETNLIDNYKTEININNVKSKEHEDVKCMFRQIKRFKYSVENLDYKLVIMWKWYICVVHRDNEVSCFFIKNFKPQDYQKQLLVCTDLEMLFNKNVSIHGELLQVKQGLEQIINKNYNINIDYISSLVKSTINIQHIHTLFTKKHNIIMREKKETTELIEEVIMKEKEFKKESKHEGLRNIIKIKDGLIVKLNAIINRRSHLILTFDKILFDNIIMLDKISKNINLLNEI